MEKSTIKTAQNIKNGYTIPPAFSRILPFALYMAFVALQELAPLVGVKLPEQTGERLYPIKIGLVAIALVIFWKHYNELRLSDLRRLRDTALSIAAGALVFIAWINIDFSFAVQGEQTSFNPNMFESSFIRHGMLAVRMAGAVVIVPLMEELFWRSFLARYMLKKDFLNAPIGRFTPLSFLMIMILFGLEHQLFVAGMIAGAVYNLLLIHTKSIVQCILSHAVTNLALAVYVLTTGQWRFW